jgi:UDP-2-acetamido-3-amino-2,3-dideoxy-glucuronate N-acetyltransferase
MLKKITISFINLLSDLKRNDTVIDKTAVIGLNTKIWKFSQLRENVYVGSGCSVGCNVYIGPGVVIGNNVKIQNNALIYEPAVVEDGVFIGPGVIFTNDLNPRSINIDESAKTELDWEKTGVKVKHGASIGAGSICVAPVIINEWAMIAAGSVVTEEVAPFALVAGVPAKRIGWVGKSGFKLIEKELNVFECPETGTRYQLIKGTIHESG